MTYEMLEPQYTHVFCPNVQGEDGVYGVFVPIQDFPKFLHGNPIGHRFRMVRNNTTHSVVNRPAIGRPWRDLTRDCDWSYGRIQDGCLFAGAGGLNGHHVMKLNKEMQQ